MVANADRVLELPRQSQEGLPQDGTERDGIVVVAELLGQLLLQDIERKSGDGDADAHADDGVSLRDGVSKDRMLSVHDPELRHGHKSSRRRFNGHKAAIVVDTDSQLITAVCKGRRENVPRGRLDRRVWTVVVQDKCPPKRSAEMSPVYWGIVSDVDAGRVAGDRRVGGVSASMYRLTVSLWRPNSLAILRMDMPSSLAFCTASQRACCRNVDLLGEVVTVMETTSASSMKEP